MVDHKPQLVRGPISLGDEEAVKQVLVQTVYSLWDIVNNLTQIKPTKQDRYRVTIFGSARTQPGSEIYQECKRVAKVMAEMGCDIITGGGPGLMQAANEGAAAANAAERDRSVGIRVDLPFEQEVNPFVQQAFEHKTFFTRLHHFVLASNAFVVAPGGIGTVLETMMIWQLLQVQHVDNTPLILVGKMWPGLVEWARSVMMAFDPPLASVKDFAIPQCVDRSDEAIEIIRAHHEEWLQKQAAAK